MASDGRPHALRVGMARKRRGAAPEPAAAPQTARAHLDGWSNILTDLGVSGRDKRLGASFLADRLSDETCEELWEGDDLGARIVETEVGEMFRAGFDLNVRADDDDTGKEIAEGVMARYDDIGADEHCHRAKLFARAMGGGAVLVGADDGQTLDKPLDLRRVRDVRYLSPLPKRCVLPATWYSDPMAAKFGEPSAYRVTSDSGIGMGTGTVVHGSRLLIYQGITTTSRRRVANQGWGVSVFVRVLSVLSDFQALWGSVGHLVQDLAGNVASLDGLASMLAANDEDTIKARVRLLEFMASTLRTRIIDKNDSFDRKGVPLTNVPELLDRAGSRLAAAAGMPVTLLMGTSPGGLQSTGKGEERQFYDGVMAKQRREVQPNRDRLIKVLLSCRDGVTKGKEPEKWATESRPLYQLSESEQADVRLKQAQVDQAEFAMGAVDGDEIAASRHGGQRWSARTVIDFAARKEAGPKAVAAPEPDADETTGEPVTGKPGEKPPEAA